MTTGSGHSMSSFAQAPFKNPMSYGALWATSTAPVANSRKVERTASRRGASATAAFVMPVSDAMKGVIGIPGFTNVANSASTTPPLMRTAPNSVMPASAGAPPVVSRSTTTKVTPDRGWPRSSSVSCAVAGITRITLCQASDIAWAPRRDVLSHTIVSPLCEAHGT